MKNYSWKYFKYWLLVFIDILTVWTPWSIKQNCIFVVTKSLPLLLPFSLPDNGNSEENSLPRSVSVATGLNSIVKRPRVCTIFPHTAGNNSTLLGFDEGDIITLLIPDERDGWMYGEMEKNGKWVKSDVPIFMEWTFDDGYNYTDKERHAFLFSLHWDMITCYTLCICTHIDDKCMPQLTYLLTS